MVVYGGRRRTHVLGSASSFAKLHLSDALRRALLLAGYRKPTLVQETAIPLARSGCDLVVRGDSGSGKTLVFALACLDRVDASSSYPQVLVLTPNREVAQHDATEIQKIASNLPYPHLSCGVFTDETSPSEDRRQLRHPCHVIVGTPGRLRWLRQRGLLSLNKIRLVVLDEADRLYMDKTTLISILSHLPEGRQSLAFSSAYAPDMLDQIEGAMDYPHRLFVDENGIEGDRHCYRVMDGGLKKKAQAMTNLLNQLSIREGIVYCNRQADIDVLSSVLDEAGYTHTRTIHSPDPSSFEIEHIRMSVDRQQQQSVIISTDVDQDRVDRVDVVIHMDLPINAATYRRRMNCMSGSDCALSVSFVSTSEQEQLQEFVNGMERQLMELPEEIPTEWCKDPFARESTPSPYENIETPKLPQDIAWTGGSKSEFLTWTERLERKYPCCHHWGLSSLSRSSSRDGCLRYHSEGHQEMGNNQRRTNCIRLPSRLSRSTSASSVVYSEEGECECFDEDLWSTDQISHNAVSLPLQPPKLPPEMPSISDFNSVRDQYEEWRKAYTEWHTHYEAWYKTVQMMPHQMP